LSEGLGVAAELGAGRLRAMNARVDHLLEDVLRLPAEERSAVAAALIDSLESSDEAAVSEAWRTELVKRRDDLRSGRATGQPWADVRARLGRL
jgi:putative addiction module component (TIGR02574 family)